MTGATYMHGEENGAESWNMFMTAFCAFVVAGNLLDFESKEKGDHHNNEAEGDHNCGEDLVGFGDKSGRDDHCK